MKIAAWYSATLTRSPSPVRWAFKRAAQIPEARVMAVTWSPKPATVFITLPPLELKSAIRPLREKNAV